MAQITKEQVFKYLTGFQLVMALLWWFIQTFGVDTDKRLALAIALIVLAGFLYVKDRSYKKDIQMHELPPDILMALSKLQKFIEGMLVAEINEARESTKTSRVVENSTGASEGDPSRDSSDYTPIS